MSANLQRALVLIEQARHGDAERELRGHVAANPDDAVAHALLGLCLAQRQRLQEATDEAQAAIRLAPDLAYAHYALASVLEDRRRLDEAAAAVEEAIRLAPEDADSFALLAQIQLNRRRWPDALEAAEQALRLDPEHTDANNLRAMALVRLGRKREAGQSIDAALARDPENAVTHANQGWTLLHRGDHAGALEHFREALRLDARLGWAREGLVEALKAQNPVYGLMLRYFLWMSTLSRRAQWAVILGGMFGYRAVRGVARANPALAPWLMPLLIAYGIFAVLTWIADPLFNLVLRLNRYGRYALTREQMVASTWVGVCVLGALAAAGAALVTREAAFVLAMFASILLVLLVAGTFRCSAGWPRRLMAGYTGLVALVALVALAVALGEARTSRGIEDLAESAAIGLFGLAVLGAIAGTWLATGLSLVTPKR